MIERYLRSSVESTRMEMPKSALESLLISSALKLIKKLQCIHQLASLTANIRRRRIRNKLQRRIIADHSSLKLTLNKTLTFSSSLRTCMEAKVSLKRRLEKFWHSNRICKLSMVLLALMTQDLFLSQDKRHRLGLGTTVPLSKQLVEERQ